MAAKLCNVCGKRRVGTTGEDPASAKHSGMCGLCYDEGGWENTHQDNNHEAIKQFGPQTDYEVSEQDDFMVNCWICHPELNLAQTWKGGTKGGTKKQSARRPQLNHKGHKHSGTPAARRACKAAFWAEMAKSGITPANISALPFAEWDYDCTPQGKPWPSKPAKMTVVPRGPKGGVINKLKEHKP